MAEVSVRINGYLYTVGCEDGQEGHLQSMAGEVDRRITSIKAVGGQSGEARLLLLAALLLADELHDMKREKGAPQAMGADPALARRLHVLAERAETIAERLEPC